MDNGEYVTTRIYEPIHTEDVVIVDDVPADNIPQEELIDNKK